MDASTPRDWTGPWWQNTCCSSALELLSEGIAQQLNSSLVRNTINVILKVMETFNMPNCLRHGSISIQNLQSLFWCAWISVSSRGVPREIRLQRSSSSSFIALRIIKLFTVSYCSPTLNLLPRNKHSGINNWLKHQMPDKPSAQISLNGESNVPPQCLPCTLLSVSGQQKLITSCELSGR